MAQTQPEPNTDQLTMWRNLLDAFGQLSAAWETAADVQKQAGPGHGPGTLHIPEELITAFARAGNRGAEALAGLAEVLNNQHGVYAFDEVASTQEHAAQAWSAAHEQVKR